MKKGRQSNVEYKGPGIQRKTGKKTGGLICRFIYD